MKTSLKFFFLVVIISTVIFSGCKKDDDNDITPTYQNSLTATVGGVQFTASLPIAQMALGNIQIGGGNAAGSLQIILAYDVVAGTVSINDNTDEAIYWSSGSDSYWPGTGAVVVTKHDTANNTIEGTFTADLEEFSTSAPLKITGGIFKIKYVKQ